MTLSDRETLSTDRSEEQKQAGRGGLAVLVAKVFFIATGLVQQALLPRAIGRADYGALARVLAVANVFNNVIVSGSTQGVSRTVAAAGTSERTALRVTLRVHLGIAAIASGLMVALSPLVAHFQGAPEVLAPLVTMAAVLAIYGVYAPLVGYLNGRRMFGKQASLDMLAATMRTTLMVGVGWLFVKGAADMARRFGTVPGVLGATLGAVLASLGVFLVALGWTGTGETQAQAADPSLPSAKDYVARIVPLMAAQLFVNGLMQADIFMLGHYLSLSSKLVEVPLGPSGHATDPATAANEWVAVYRACQLFAFLPYQLLFSVTQVLFPMLARAQREDGPSRVAELVSRGARIGAITTGLMATVVVALPSSLLRLAYDADIAASGHGALRVLVLGQSAFAMLGLTTTILVSLGRERAAMGLSALALLAMVSASALAVPHAAFGEAQIFMTAIATTAALVASLVFGVFAAKRTAGAFVPRATALRVGACVALAALLSPKIPMFSRVTTLAAGAGVAFVYVAILVVTGELGKRDLDFILSLVPKRLKLRS
jgi:stage V sporulation protein B